MNIKDYIKKRRFKIEKNNISKIIIAIILIILVAIGIIAANKFTTTKKTIGDKTVTITIEDQVNHKTIMDKETFQTNATTLKEFLNENKDELKVETTNEGSIWNTSTWT